MNTEKELEEAKANLARALERLEKSPLRLFVDSDDTENHVEFEEFLN